MSRPLIGVTGPVKGGAAAWYCTRLAIWRAGGRAVRITPEMPRDISDLDGLVIGGGADVDPELYGATLQEMVPTLREQQWPRRNKIRFLISILFLPLVFLFRRLLSAPTMVAVDRDRDRLEMNLIEGALESGRPMLGICRGMQLLNVQCGGDLHQEISDFYTETPEVQSIFPQKVINVKPESKLQKVLEAASVKVNALHRQAIKSTCAGLQAVAHDLNGVVQAVEHREHPFVIGVQWHPEYLPQIRHQQAIFAALIAAAKKPETVHAEPVRD